MHIIGVNGKMMNTEEDTADLYSGRSSDEDEATYTKEDSETTSSRTYLTDIELDNSPYYGQLSREYDGKVDEDWDSLENEEGGAMHQRDEFERFIANEGESNSERTITESEYNETPTYPRSSHKVSEQRGLTGEGIKRNECEMGKNASKKEDDKNGADDVKNDECKLSWERQPFDEQCESLDCDMCSVEGYCTLASVYCFDCEIYLCETCQRWHGKLQSSRDHFSMTKEQILEQMHAQKSSMVAKPETETEKTSKTRNIQKVQLFDPRKHRMEEVTVDRKTVCGPCMYGGTQEQAYGVCLDCVEYLCGACTAAHLAVSSHKIIDINEMHKESAKQIVPVYEEESYKEFFERATPQQDNTRAHILDKKIDHVTSFSTRIFEDLQYPSVTGLAFTWDSRILVCDRNNERLKIFSQELTPLNSLIVADLADVTVIDKITAVCTLPVKRKLAFVDLKKELKLLKFADTAVKYWGIEYLNHELFALVVPEKDSPSCIHILDTTGHIISMIYPQCSLTDNTLTKYPKYLAISPSGGTVYVTDKANRVVALGLDGRVIFQYESQEMKNASGLVTDNRNVYVCLEEASCLVQVSLDGSDSSTALGHTNNLDRPCCVAMDVISKRLIISELHTSIVQVFQM